jgi:hypothetical protein
MKTLKVYDPAMCCSSGVCGPSPDSKLMKLAEDLAFLKSQGVEVERFNLGHQAQAFAENPLVLNEMGAEAEHLPIFVIDSKVKAKGRYPSRDELASWFGVEVSASQDKPHGLNVVKKGGCCCG